MIAQDLVNQKSSNTAMSLYGIIESNLLDVFHFFPFLCITKEAFPARFKGFWNVQEPWYIPLLFKVMQPFLSQKMQDRVSTKRSQYSVHGYHHIIIAQLACCHQPVTKY